MQMSKLQKVRTGRYVQLRPKLTTESVGFAFILPFPGPGESISMSGRPGCTDCPGRRVEIGLESIQSKIEQSKAHMAHADRMQF